MGKKVMIPSISKAKRGENRGKAVEDRREYLYPGHIVVKPLHTLAKLPTGLRQTSSDDSPNTIVPPAE
jgi:hypothetical protein